MLSVQCYQYCLTKKLWKTYFTVLLSDENLSKPLMEILSVQKGAFQMTFLFSTKITEAALWFKVVWKPQTLKFWKTKVWSAICPPPSLCWNTLRDRVLPWSYKTCKHSFDSVPLGKKIFKQSIIFFFPLTYSNRRCGWFQTALWQANDHSLISEMIYAKSVPLSYSSTWLML